MSIQLRSQYSDLVLGDALPALDFIVEQAWESFAAKHEQVFNVKDMATAIAQSTQVSALQAAGSVGEAEEIPMQRKYQGYSKTYQAVKYGILLATSQELLDDMQYDVMGQDARRLAQAVMETVETVSADVLNDGFSTNGLDGVPLFSASHPLLAPGAGLGTNLLGTPSDLSMTSLKAMSTLLRKTVDTAGNKINLRGKQLIVSPDDEFTARELLKSTYLVDAGNANVNAINSVQSEYNLNLVVWDYLTDADAFFLQADGSDHFMTFYWRQRPETATEKEFKSDVALTRILTRFAVGYSDWRGIVGTAGA